MDESEVKITTPTMVVVADSTVVTGGQTFGFTTGTFRSGLLAAEAGVTMTAKNIVLVGKGGSLDLDVLYEVTCSRDTQKGESQRHAMYSIGSRGHAG